MVSAGVLQAMHRLLIRDAMSHRPGQCAVANSQLKKVTALSIMPTRMVQVCVLLPPPN
jgi:hypothetical protein